MKNVPFLEVCDIQGGTQPPKSEWIKEARDGYVRMLQIRDFTQPDRPKIEYVKNRSTLKKCKKGDILVARYGASIGKILVGLEGAYNVAMVKCIWDRNLIERNYLLFWLRSPSFQHIIANVGSRAAQAGFNKTDLNDLLIPIPPLEEQKRIAGILDKVETLRDKRIESLGQLDTLIQSTFLDMFGDPVTNPMGWEECTVGDVVHSAKDGPHVSPKYSESGIPFLSTRHIKPGEVIWKDLKYIDQDEANRQWKKCKPELGDILYSKGGTTGIAARVNTSDPFAVWVHVALLKPIVEKVHPIWLETMLNTVYCYTQSQKYTHGIANRDLGLNRMVKIKVYLPPLNEQIRYTAIVESLENLRAKQRGHLVELDTLFSSLQQRAFQGEL